jgi:hypothetical protein
MSALHRLFALIDLILVRKFPESLNFSGNLHRSDLLFISFIFYLLFLPLLRL